jgi:hypothetical protein
VLPPPEAGPRLGSGAVRRLFGGLRRR